MFRQRIVIRGDAFNDALLQALQKLNVDLVVLAGCLVVIPKSIVRAFPNRIINIHPALIPVAPRYRVLRAESP